MSKTPRMFDPPSHPDGRLDAPAFHRNHEPIWSVLAPYLERASGHVLEAGSGTGQHVVEFARKSPQLTWWPADYDPQHLQSIDAWRRQANLPNIQPARFIDLSAPDWGLNAEDSKALTGLAAIFCANVIHIAPLSVAEGLLTDAARRLRRDGRLILYGPFMRDGAHTAPSNAAFDQSLRARNPEWGVRDIADLEALAKNNGLSLADIIPDAGQQYDPDFQAGLTLAAHHAHAPFVDMARQQRRDVHAQMRIGLIIRRPDAHKDFMVLGLRHVEIRDHAGRHHDGERAGNCLQIGHGCCTVCFELGALNQRVREGGRGRCRFRARWYFRLRPVQCRGRGKNKICARPVSHSGHAVSFSLLVLCLGPSPPRHESFTEQPENPHAAKSCVSPRVEELLKAAPFHLLQQAGCPALARHIGQPAIFTADIGRASTPPQVRG